MQRDTNDNKLRFICHGIAVCILLVGNDVHPNKNAYPYNNQECENEIPPPTPQHTHTCH